MQEITIDGRNINDVFRLRCCRSVSKGSDIAYLMYVNPDGYDVALQGDIICVESADSPTCDIIMGEYHKSLLTKQQV